MRRTSFCGDRLAGVKKRASVRWILKGDGVGNRDKLVGDCRFKTKDFRHIKGIEYRMLLSCYPLA